MKTPLYSAEEIASAHAELEQLMPLAVCRDLGAACSEGRLEMAIGLMREAYAALDAHQIRGLERFALGTCVTSGNLGVAIALIHAFPCICQEARDDALIVAITSRYPHFCDEILQHGANVNARDREKDSSPALLMAVRGHSEAARVLLDHGADVTAADRLGFTPLHFAARHGDHLLCERMIGAGACFEAVNHKGTTPLMMCAIGGDEKSALVLLRHGASLELLSQDGQTALAMAVKAPNSSLMEILVAAGASTQGLKSRHFQEILDLSRLQASIRQGDSFLIQQAIEKDDEPSTLPARVTQACDHEESPGAGIARALMAALSSRRAIEESLAHFPKPALMI